VTAVVSEVGIVAALLDLVPARNRFFLNLDRRPDRRIHAEAQFARAGLAPIRIAAVDGRSLPAGLACGLSPTSARRCTLAEAACSLSHIGLWKVGVERGEPIMVFEDDVHFCNDIAAHLRRPLDLPLDFGVLYLGAAWREPLRRYAGPGIYELLACRTTHAYVASATACASLLALASELPHIAADHYTGLSHRRGVVRAHIPLPFWAVQRADHSDIGQRLPAKISFGTLFDGELPTADC
jgi:hypothetical protein